jgi:hypothetical protein
LQVTTPPKLALLSGEPAGRIPTRTPGAVRFEATLTWQNLEEAVQRNICPPLPGSVKAFISESGEPGGVRYISGEILAFAEEELESALDSILQEVSSTAALSEAVLEMHCVRVAHPRVAARDALERLARGLWEGGLGVRFGPCWTPLYGGAEVAVGIRGAEGVYERLRDLDSWEIASPPL